MGDSAMRNDPRRLIALSFALFSALAFFPFVCAQTRPNAKQNARQIAPEAPAKSTGEFAAEPVFIYEFTQPEFYVRHIIIEHDVTGKGKISFERKDVDDVLSDQLELSPAALARINALWQALGYLESRTSYQAKKQFAHLGTIKLCVKRDGKEKWTTFNWTEDKSAAALATEYRRLADQAILVFDLKVARENQPLATPKLLDTLEHLLARNELADPSQLVPLLRDLAMDERLPLIARNAATRALKKIERMERAEK
jgi:hypothetical protein